MRDITPSLYIDDPPDEHPLIGIHQTRIQKMVSTLKRSRKIVHHLMMRSLGFVPRPKWGREFSRPLAHGGSMSKQRQTRTYSPPDDLKDHLDAKMQSLLGVALSRLPAMADSLAPRVVQQLTFREVVAYFANKHPGDASIRSGALLWMPHPRGNLIFQLFLDQNDGLCFDGTGRPYGRQLVAMDLDSELSARLRHADLLLFR